MTFNNHARRPEAVSGNKQEGFITIARVTRTQGRKGEVAASLFTDFPERFADRKRLFLMNPLDDARMELQLDEHWFHKGQVVLKFAGVDSISDAERLVGCEVQIPLAERATLEDGSFYISDLTGCRVFEKGREIGLIEDVRLGSGEAPLLVVQGKKEYLIPFAAAYIEELDVSQKRLVMQLPEGMLELDAPLNEEEKQRQKKQD